MESTHLEKLIESYKPIIIEGVNLSGISGGHALDGEELQVIIRAFVTSFEDFFSIVANDLMKVFSLQNEAEKINSLLIKIDDSGKAYVYKNFPVQHQVRLKKSVKAGMPIFKGDILDIEGVVFEDDFTKIPFTKTDKIIWLFRQDWKFGLYFDFSQNIDEESLSKELASCYKKLDYYNIYNLIDREDHFFQVLDDGWFCSASDGTRKFSFIL